MRAYQTGCLLIILMLFAASCTGMPGGDDTAGQTAAAGSPTAGRASHEAWIITATSTPALSPSPTPAPTATPAAGSLPEQNTAGAAAPDAGQAFFPQQLSGSLYGISFGMDIAEVEEKLGPPVQSKSFAYYEGYNIRYYYDDCEVAFTPRYHKYRDSDGAYVSELTDQHDVYEITVRDPDYDGPRGIRIGDGAEQVFEKFGYPPEWINGAADTVYQDDETLIDLDMEGGEVTKLGMLFEDGGADFVIFFSNWKVDRYSLSFYLE